MQYFLHCLKNYFNIHGRSSKIEFWEFYKFYCILLLINIAIGFTIFIFTKKLLFIYLIPLIYLVFIIPPYYSVTVRRLHDIGKSGFVLFKYTLIIFVGWIQLVLLLSEIGDSKTNKYGEVPKFN